MSLIHPFATIRALKERLHKALKGYDDAERRHETALQKDAAASNKQAKASEDLRCVAKKILNRVGE